jgi:predicted metal-dependent peptidase
MGPDLRSAIERYPALAGIALWVRFADSAEQNFIAATDGRTVYAGSAYAIRSEKERLFILLHELLHVALAHPARMRQLRKRHQDFDPLVYNIACDAIINASLEGGVGVSAPADAIQLEPLLQTLELWPPFGKVDEVVRKWSSEALYRAIMQKREWLIGPEGILLVDLTGQGNRSGATGSGPYVIDVREGQASGNGQEQERGDRATETEIREWARRLQLTRGVIPGMLERLAGELPQVKTQWEKVLRNYLYRRLGQRHYTDYSRPSRRWLGLEYELHHREGVALPFEPDRTRPGLGGRIAVAVDTSGSIDDEALQRFSGEIAAIMARTASRVLLIVCDAGVHQIEELEGLAGQTKLRKLRYQGGGGTDFRPAIEVASQWKPDVMVYLTDLQGPAGEAPSFPLVWALPPGLPETRPPWGLLLELD